MYLGLVWDTCKIHAKYQDTCILLECNRAFKIHLRYIRIDEGYMYPSGYTQDTSRYIRIRILITNPPKRDNKPPLTPRAPLKNRRWGAHSGTGGAAICISPFARVGHGQETAPRTGREICVRVTHCVIRVLPCALLCARVSRVCPGSPRCLFTSNTPITNNKPRTERGKDGTTACTTVHRDPYIYKQRQN